MISVLMTACVWSALISRYNMQRDYRVEVLMDNFDRDRYASAYRLLAEILERNRPADPVEGHMSYILGDLTRRVFVGSQFDPPDEILEQTAQVMRSGSDEARKKMADRLRRHAIHLDELNAEHD